MVTSFLTNFGGSGGISTNTSTEHAHNDTTGSGELNMNSNKIINLGTPTENEDATTKQYVDTNKHNMTENLNLNSREIVNSRGLIFDNSSRIMPITSGDVIGIELNATNGVYISSGNNDLLSISNNLMSTQTNVALNSKQLRFKNNDTSRINAIGESIEIVSPSAIFLKSGNSILMSLTTSQISMHDRQIKNLLDPTDDKDAATKAYVDYKVDATKLKNSYKKVITDHSPKFWISSKFPFGFESGETTVQDLTGNGLTISGGVVNSTSGTSLSINQNTTLKSTATFAKYFTFFIKARRTSSTGRLFTSSSGNKVLGWYNSHIKCAWMDGDIYGVANHSQRTTGDTNVHTYILTNNNDAKEFLDEKTTVISTNNGVDTWDGNVVLGRPVRYASETGAGQFFEVLCFDKVLTKTQIFDIYDKIFA